MHSGRKALGDIGNTYNGLQDRAKQTTSTSTEAKPRSQACVELSPRFDAKFSHSAVHATAYIKDIVQYLRRTEALGRPSQHYMVRMQNEITPKMRTILVDWIVDVHLKFKLRHETLFLTIEIIDRYLDKKAVSRQKLQLIGVVALLLASKYEEIYPPEVKDCIYISANTYTRDDVLRAERAVFQSLDFNLTFPTLFPFLKRGLQVMDADTRTQQLAQFIAELALLEIEMLAHLPSVIAASCIYLANKFLDKQPWTRVLEHYCMLKSGDLEQCSRDLLAIVRQSVNQKTQAVRRKYSYPKYGEVTKLTQVDIQLP